MPDSNPARRLNTDLIVSGAAIFISLCTLVVLLYEVRILREQQRAAVWPYVEIGAGFTGQGFHILTSNQGIGPARVQSMRVHVDGDPVRTWEAMFQALGVDRTDWSQDKTNGRVIPAQTTIASLQAPGAVRADRVHDAYVAADPRITFALCYCSVYDECWRLAQRGLNEERAPVAACRADPAREFLR